MRRLLALIMALSFLLVPLGAMNNQVAAAGELPWAEVSGIKLTLKDSVSFGNYVVTVTDIDSVTWSKAMIRVSGPEGTKEFTISDNEVAYYPSSEKPVLGFSAIIWNAGGTPTVLLTISSPLRNVFTSAKTMRKGQTITLLSNAKVTLLKVNNESAEFQVTTTKSFRFTLEPGEGQGVLYRLSSNTNEAFDYANFVYVYLNKTTNTKATVEFYMPKVIFTSIKISREGSDSGSSQPETQPEEECSCLMFNDNLYVGEKLGIKYDDTTYQLQITSVTSTKVGVRVYKGKDYENYVLSIGQSKKISGTSMMFVVSSAEPKYNRAILKLYAPTDAQITPPVREAVIKANITSIPEKILLSDYLVVAISVDNDGKGDAYDLNVAAPIPNEFELVSSTQSWNIKTLPAFSKMPALIYVLKPTKVGTFEIGKAVVKYYDDKSLLSGAQNTVYSSSLKGIVVYAIPSIEVNALAYNGTWSNYVMAEKGETVKLKFYLKAGDGDPNYEFVTNATLHLQLGNSLDGSTEINVGTIKAGESKDVMIDVKVLNESLTNIRAVLTYLDPLGNEHSIDLGTLVTINSIPPKVVTHEVKVWPTPEELPEYVNKTLSKMEDPEPLAQELSEVSKLYLPSKVDTWKILAILFIALTIVFGAMAYKYWDSSERCRRILEKKKAKRPGGLPKKEEEETAANPPTKREGGL